MALAVIASVALMGQVAAPKVAKVVEAKKFVARDASGKVRAAFGVLADGIASLVLADRAGKVRAALSVPPLGVPGLSLYDKDEKVIWSAP